MSKVASYLQEHIAGEVSVQPYILDAMSRDGSVLQVTPEMVIYPRTTNDIRKIARFSWQLAERGHTLPITPRGAGGDMSGAAIGKGVVLSFPAHMNAIFEYEPRRKLVRIQPGANARALSDALWLHGAGIPALPDSSLFSTVGGAVANNSGSMYSGKYGFMKEWVDQLEIILANGEVIQTGRISKRELNRKKGLETLEGEVYRSLDNLIEDNKDLVRELAVRADYTNGGYVSIASVKKRDGSFDLTPLFMGSQGTLGIISEMILRTEYISGRRSVMIAVFEDSDTARNSLDSLARLNPAFLDYFDGDLLKLAIQAGKRFDFTKEAGFVAAAALVVGFDDRSDRRRAKSIKKAGKLLDKTGAWWTSGDGESANGLMALYDSLSFAGLPDGAGVSAPPLLRGMYIPTEQFSVFAAGMAALSTKYHLSLPLYGRELSSLYYAWPTFNLKRAGDKQKLFKLLEDVSALVTKTGGEFVGESGEGRLNSRLMRMSFDEETIALFEAVKMIFDPYGILNPGVKQATDIKHLAGMIRDEYHPPAVSGSMPYV